MLLKHPSFLGCTRGLGDFNADLANARAMLASAQARCAALGGYQKKSIGGVGSNAAALNAQVDAHNAAVNQCAQDVAYWQAMVNSLASQPPPTPSVQPVSQVAPEDTTPRVRQYQPVAQAVTTTNTSEVPGTPVDTMLNSSQDTPTPAPASIPWGLILSVAFAIFESQ